jgi:hypothetical protein
MYRCLSTNFSYTRARLKGANLFEADLSRATLSEANFSGADLGDADMSNTTFWETIFSYNDFRLVKGLVTAKHFGPSHVDLYSVQFPQDGSALHFLRGAGVPDQWIDIYRAEMMHPIQYHSVFISYSSHDTLLAQRLHAEW